MANTWTDEDINKLVVLMYDGRDSSEEIAAQLYRSPYAVTAKLRQLRADKHTVVTHGMCMLRGESEKAYKLRKMDAEKEVNRRRRQLWMSSLKLGMPPLKNDQHTGFSLGRGCGATAPQQPETSQPAPKHEAESAEFGITFTVRGEAVASFKVSPKQWAAVYADIAVESKR